jgi:hypothetical protein
MLSPQKWRGPALDEDAQEVCITPLDLSKTQPVVNEKDRWY